MSPAPLPDGSYRCKHARVIWAPADCHYCYLEGIGTTNEQLDEKFDRAASGIAQPPELTAAQHLEKAQHHLLCAQQILSSVK